MASIKLDCWPNLCVLAPHCCWP